MNKLITAYLIATEHYLADCKIMHINHRYGGSGVDVKIENECASSGYETIQIDTFNLLEFMWSKIEHD